MLKYVTSYKATQVIRFTFKTQSQFLEYGKHCNFHVLGKLKVENYGVNEGLYI